MPNDMSTTDADDKDDDAAPDEDDDASEAIASRTGPA